MLQALNIILELQEYDMKMIRLMRLKKERLGELNHIESLRNDLEEQVKEKEVEIADLNKEIIVNENKILEIKDRLKKLEARQISIKKVDEFNALTLEMSQSERERITTEKMTSDLIDKRNLEEEVLEKIKSSLISSKDNSDKLIQDIKESIKKINEEGRIIKAKRDEIAKNADLQILAIYEKLLQNKKDRVIVPIENRTCNGCHIALTAQHENSVRKGERLIFCEHCSRILFWQDMQELESEGSTTKRRRRRVLKK